MGLWSKIFGDRFWKMQSLPDFWRVTLWMEEQRQAGRNDQATVIFLQHMHRAIRKSIGEYVTTVQKLNKVVGGLYDDPDAAYRAYPNMPSGKTPMTRMKELAWELRVDLGHIDRGGKEEFVARWLLVLDDDSQFGLFISKLVEQFGSFEKMVVMLPGTGEETINARTQKCLQKMFDINLRNIRMLTTIREIRLAWQQGEGSFGIFDGSANVGKMLKSMLVEYMVRADPIRIAKKTKGGSGKPHHRYRFWRPAENLRQMWNVDYVGEKRQPKPQRPFVNYENISAVAPMAMDVQRVEWALKEIFNNSLSATSVMTQTGDHQFLAKPLPRHNHEKPRPAIALLSRPSHDEETGQATIRVIIMDDGVGMNARDVDHATFWAYSPRRASYVSDSNDVSGDRAIEIGGKGIGLAFARHVIDEHGGELTIESAEDGGTCVTMVIPVGMFQ